MNVNKGNTYMYVHKFNFLRKRNGLFLKKYDNNINTKIIFATRINGKIVGNRQSYLPIYKHDFVGGEGIQKHTPLVVRALFRVRCQ